MNFENDELKMLNKFRMYIKITKTSNTTICNEAGITSPTLKTIMKDYHYIPQKNVRDKINLFMENKLKVLDQLISN